MEIDNLNRYKNVFTLFREGVGVSFLVLRSSQQQQMLFESRVITKLIQNNIHHEEEEQYKYFNS